MASPNIYTGGIGGTSGSELATAGSFIASGQVWYVHSTTGADAVSPRGLDRARPLATLAQAYTNASAGDTICFLSGHAETLTAQQVLGKSDLKLISEGTGSNRARFTRNANMVMFDLIDFGGVVLSNLYFPESTTTSASSRVRSAVGAVQIRDCYFECGAKDTGAAFETVSGAATLRVINTSFVSTATSLSAQPHSAIKVTNALTDLDLEAVVFSGGTVGWSNQFAFNGAAAISRLRGWSVDLLLDSDLTLATSTTGFLIVRNKSGSARVVWTA